MEHPKAITLRLGHHPLAEPESLEELSASIHRAGPQCAAIWKMRINLQAKW